MRLNRLFSVAMLSMLFGGSAWVQQPYSGCWHPDDKSNKPFGLSKDYWAEKE